MNHHLAISNLAIQVIIDLVTASYPPNKSVYTHPCFHTHNHLEWGLNFDLNENPILTSNFLVDIQFIPTYHALVVHLVLISQDTKLFDGITIQQVICLKLSSQSRTYVYPPSHFNAPNKPTPTTHPLTIAHSPSKLPASPQHIIPISNPSTAHPSLIQRLPSSNLPPLPCAHPTPSLQTLGINLINASCCSLITLIRH